MNTRFLKHSLVAAFALAGVTAISPQSQALAGDTTSITLATDATATPTIGDRLEDGSIYAGNGFVSTPADAPGLYIWIDGNRYCEALEANGHDDWILPTKDQLNQLRQNKDMGSFARTFNDDYFGPDWYEAANAGWYWSSTEGISSSAYTVKFSDGYGTGDDGREVWHHKDRYTLSVRCVRAEPAGP